MKPPVYHLRLYVTGMAPRSKLAIESLVAFCEEHLPGRYRLEVVDVYQNPEAAREGGIIAVPTLMCVRPHSSRRMVGDLSDTGRVLAGLGIVA